MVNVVCLMASIAAIIPAAGRSLRYGADKLLEPLCGQSVLVRSLHALWDHAQVDGLFVPTENPAVAALAESLPRDVTRDVLICPGGPSRAHSVLSALRQVPEKYEWVAIHDAARPLLSAELIDRTFAAAKEYGAAAPALPVALTIKQAVGPLPAKADRTLPRHQLWAMQTPQIMRRRDLIDAYDRCTVPLEQVTDDAQLLELAGREVWLVPGEERNIKITTPLDLRLAEVLLEGRERS